MKLFSGILFGIVLFAGSAEAKKTFVYCSEASPSQFNPQLATDGPTFNSTGPIYNRLVEFKIGETTIQPALAESWKISPDNLTYTFKLRKGVKWHTTKDYTPTRDFNADDVLFTYNRMRDPAHPFHKVSGGNYEYFNSMEMGTMIKDIKKVDAYTVQFVLNKAEAPFLADLAMEFASILSAEYGDKVLKAGKPESIDQSPVGTGPFVWQSYSKDQMIRYKAHASYFRGKVALDELVFTITPDASVRTQKLKTGECHLIAEPSQADLADMRKNEKLKVMERAGLNVGYLAMNVEKQPFNNVGVRKAVNLALNRKAYLDAIYLGNAMQAKNPIPPTIWSYNNDIRDYAYDPVEARKLLAQAGYDKGFEVELWTLPVSRPYNPNGKKMGEMMQADLAKVGIKAKLITFDWPTYLEKSRKGEHQMIQLGWTGDNGDPDNFLAVLLGCEAVKAGSNLARWCNKEFEGLITDAKSATSVTKRTQLYQKAQSVFKQEAPWVTLAHSKVFRAMRKNVDGYKIDPFGRDIFSDVDLK